jgi:hypothetical protein
MTHNPNIADTATASNTNTGDQTITLTGPVTGSGVGSFATTITDKAVTLAKMDDLAQDKFIIRTTASTGVPETATCTAAARTVLDDTTVAAMVDTLGGASSTGSGGLARATSPTFVTPLLGTPTSGTLTNCTGLPVAGGGTGASTLTAHGVVIGNGTSAVNVTSAGTSGQVLTSNGASADPTFQAAAAGTPVYWGPFAPDSITLATPATNFPTVYDSGSSTGTRYEDMVGIAASIASDSKVECYWDLPTTLPTGTLKLRVWMRANATSGNAKVNPKWACVTAGDDPGATALSAEGVQTITWAAGDAHKYKEYKFSLVATSAVAGKRLIMSLVFETASYTLAAAAGVHIALLYE